MPVSALISIQIICELLLIHVTSTSDRDYIKIQPNSNVLPLLYLFSPNTHTYIGFNSTNASNHNVYTYVDGGQIWIRLGVRYE